MRKSERRLSLDRPTPGPSQEGSRQSSAPREFPSQEGLGVGSWFQSMRKIVSWVLDVLLMFGFGCTGLRNFPISGGLIASMRAKTLVEALSSQYPSSFFLCSAEGSGSFFFVIASWPASLSRRDSAALNSVLAWYSAGNDASA